MWMTGLQLAHIVPEVDVAKVRASNINLEIHQKIPQPTNPFIHWRIETHLMHL